MMILGRAKRIKNFVRESQCVLAEETTKNETESWSYFVKHLFVVEGRETEAGT